MAATHADRAALAENPLFVARVKGALVVHAQTVGVEASGLNSDMAAKRTKLIHSLLVDPDGTAARFARAAAGSNVADAAYATAGTVNLSNVTDAQLSTYVAQSWNIISGVLPAERGA